MWTRYDTINSLPGGLWNDTVGRADVCLDSRLIRTAEGMFPEDAFRYFVRYEGGVVTALFMVMIADDTPFYGVDEFSDRVFRTASTGTPETTGCHFWYDPERITRQQFTAEAVNEILCLEESFDVIVFRDFVGDDELLWRSEFESAGFDRIEVLDVSRLVVPDEVKTLDEYIATLKYKYRYQLAQYRSALNSELYEVKPITDYLPLLSELYPLYVEVCRRAKEYQAEPYPAEYFRIVKRVFGDDAVMVTVVEKATGSYLGFMLLLYGQGSCVHQYIGFRKMDDLFLWHNLTIESIGDAIERDVRQINMGVTNSQSKHKFGAKSAKTYTFVRFREK